jgi:hypothetical protein
MRSVSAQADAGACRLTVLDNLEDSIVDVCEALLKEMKATSERMLKGRNGWVMFRYTRKMLRAKGVNAKQHAGSFRG